MEAGCAFDDKTMKDVWIFGKLTLSANISDFYYHLKLL